MTNLLKRLMLCALAGLVLAACDKHEDPGRHIPAVADQTVVVFLSGRTLSSYFDKNISALGASISAVSPGERNRLLVCSQSSSSEAELFELFWDPETQALGREQVQSFDMFDAGDPADIGEMLAAAAAAAPAARYGLVIGCHGKGWVPAGSALRSLRMSADPGQELLDDLWLPAPGAAATRCFGDPGYELDNADLAAAIAAAGLHLDYICFDACFMSSIETLYDLRHSADWIVASPCEIMAAGFPYEKVFPYLFTGDDPAEQLDALCRTFYEYYAAASTYASACVATTDCSQLETLAGIVREIHAAGTKSCDPTQLLAYEGLSSHLFYDFGQWAEAICDDPALLDAFRTQCDRTFINRYHTDSFYSAYDALMHRIFGSYTGVGTGEPATKYVTEHRLTAWYQATHP